MRTLQMIDPLPTQLGRKIEKHELTPAQEAKEIHDLSLMVFELLPHNLHGQPMLGALRVRPEVKCEFVLIDAA
jgi:hypothetical protein